MSLVMRFDRWLANFCVLGMLSLVVVQGRASERCESLFNSELRAGLSFDTSAGPIRLKFNSQISARHRSLINATATEIAGMFSSTILPKEILFDFTRGEHFEGGAADLVKDHIQLTPVAFLLSPKSFQALIAHELTHLIVVRRLKDGDRSLRQRLEENQQDSLSQHMIARQQAPFAELLCDLSAVIVTGDLRGVHDMILELKSIAANNPVEYAQLMGMLEKATMDQPQEFSLRDFSVSDSDPRWASYEPRDPDYNRMNQLRAYLGRRLSQSPKDQWPLLASPTLEALSFIFSTGQYDMISAMQGISTANQAVIQYLEQALVIEKPKAHQ